MSKFTEAYRQEADALIAALHAHMQTRMFGKVHRIGWPKCNQATRLRWGKSKKARNRRFKSYLRRMKLAGMGRRTVNDYQFAHSIPIIFDPNAPPGKVMLIGKDLANSLVFTNVGEVRDGNQE